MISFTLPIHCPSLPNLREHWSAKAKRAKKQKADTRLLCPRWTHGPLLVVRLTRVGPKELDTDNLQGALKAVRDGVASWLKVDDASPLVAWDYGQVKGKPAVRIELHSAPARYDSELNPTSMFEGWGQGARREPHLQTRGPDDTGRFDV